MELFLNANQISIIIVSFLIIFVVFYILFNRHNRKSVTDPSAFTPAAYDLLEEAIIIVNSSNKIEYINGMARSIIGTKYNKILGRNISDLIIDVDLHDISGINDVKIRNSVGENILVKIRTVRLINNKNIQEGLCLILNQSTGNIESAETIRIKLKETENQNKLLDETCQNLELEKQNIENKILENTHNLREGHARLYASINNLTFGYILTDRDKNIIIMNKTAKTQFLFAQSETNVSLNDLQANIKNNINITEKINDALKNTEPLTLKDFQINNKYTDIYISPVINRGNGKTDIIGCVILIEDKTEEWLIKRSKDNFFIIASHELRTPLTGIKGYIAIIKQIYFDSIKDEDLKRIINDIDISSSRLINIVNDFLSSSKPDQSKIAIHNQPCNLLEIIKSCIKETSSIAIEKKLFMNFNNPSFSDAIVLGDKDKIKQIIINLISNSIKYTEKGGVTVGMDKTADDQFKITINDTGKGISEENTKFLFSKFQQINSNKTGNVISSGLGLYISKILAEKMHGTIKLENTKTGEGSTFSLTLPAYKENLAITTTTKVN